MDWVTRIAQELTRRIVDGVVDVKLKVDKMRSSVLCETEEGLHLIACETSEPDGLERPAERTRASERLVKCGRTVGLFERP